jgi:hypothetical protein
MLTREVDMSMAQEAQEHLQDLIGMMDAGNGKIHLVEITVMIGLAPEGSIQHDLLCLLLHPQMLVCCLLGWVGTRHVQQHPRGIMYPLHLPPYALLVPQKGLLIQVPVEDHTSLPFHHQMVLMSSMPIEAPQILIGTMR